MQIPLQISFENAEPSEAVRAAIGHEVEPLEKYQHRITGCRVAVVAPSTKHRHGAVYRINIWVTIPPHENIVVSHQPSDDRSHANWRRERNCNPTFSTTQAAAPDLIIRLPDTSFVREHRLSSCSTRCGFIPMIARTLSKTVVFSKPFLLKDVAPRFNISGSLAMLDAIRLASSIVICFAAMASSSVERP